MVQPRQQHEAPSEPRVTIEELARRQGVQPLSSIEQLLPRESLFDDDEYAAFLEWFRDLREADIT
jgi:hypothetical protein